MFSNNALNIDVNLVRYILNDNFKIFLLKIYFLGFSDSVYYKMQNKFKICETSIIYVTPTKYVAVI